MLSCSAIIHLHIKQSLQIVVENPLLFHSDQFIASNYSRKTPSSPFRLPAYIAIILVNVIQARAEPLKNDPWGLGEVGLVNVVRSVVFVNVGAEFAV